MKTSDIKNMAAAYLQILEGSKMDPVNKDELKGAHAQRKDKDIDNNGKVDKSDEYLHKRRRAISQKIGEDTSENPANYQHLCAKQVTHESWGAGNCIPTMHAEATEDGHVEWYDVMFEHGIEKQVPISELKVVRAENHMHSKKMKKEGWDDMMKMVKDKEKEKGTGNFDKKKVSTGTVFTRKANKDGTSKGVKEGSDWTVYNRIMEKKDAHTKGATEPEAMDSKASKSEKDFVAKHGGLDGNETGIVDVDKAVTDTPKAAVDAVKVAPKRPGDQTTGDKTAPKQGV